MKKREHREYKYYKKALDNIKALYESSNSWDKVITTEVYKDSYSNQEAFLDYLEEVYKTKIDSGKQLQKLTGITEETLEGLEETVTRAKFSRYSDKLQDLLIGGAKYKDLLAVKPKDYGLPKTWSNCLASNKEEAVYWTILLEYYLNESTGLTTFPSIRKIAEDLEAPYSEILNAFNYYHNKEIK